MCTCITGGYWNWTIYALHSVMGTLNSNWLWLQWQLGVGFVVFAACAEEWNPVNWDEKRSIPSWTIFYFYFYLIVHVHTKKGIPVLKLFASSFLTSSDRVEKFCAISNSVTPNEYTSLWNTSMNINYSLYWTRFISWSQEAHQHSYFRNRTLSHVAGTFELSNWNFIGVRKCLAINKKYILNMYYLFTLKLSLS
jgi:hypothetical protein